MIRARRRTGRDDMDRFAKILALTLAGSIPVPPAAVNRSPPSDDYTSRTASSRLFDSTRTSPASSTASCRRTPRPRWAFACRTSVKRPVSRDTVPRRVDDQALTASRCSSCATRGNCGSTRQPLTTSRNFAPGSTQPTTRRQSRPRPAEPRRRLRDRRPWGDRQTPLPEADFTGCSARA